MFPKQALQFLRALEKNNNREWFESKKPVYEASVKAPMLTLVKALNQEFLQFAPDYVVDPKKAVLRIYRDIRFSKDKTPYKTNIAVGFRHHNLSKDEGASFFIQLDAKELLVAGGIYMPMPEQLKLLRVHIAEHHVEFRKLLAAKKLRSLMGELQGDLMTRVPKGFLPGDPAEDLLKRKMYIFWTTLPSAVAETPAALGEISKRLAAVAPIVEFLNRPLLAKRRPLHFDM